MIEENETFGGSWPYKARYFEGQGFRHHYVDEGRRDLGETFVCLHGEPTWGFLYRNFIPGLGELGRIALSGGAQSLRQVRASAPGSGDALALAKLIAIADQLDRRCFGVSVRP